MSGKVDEYVAITDSAAQIAHALLDLEGGNLIVATFLELAQSMLDAENISGAILTLEKAASIVNVPMPDVILKNSNEGNIFLCLLIDAMQDVLTES